MFEQTPDEGRFDPPPAYIRPSKLARILGWSRPNVYYWLNKCRIRVVDFDGHKMIPVSDLPTIVMTLRKAKEDAHARRDVAQ